MITRPLFLFGALSLLCAAPCVALGQHVISTKVPVSTNPGADLSPGADKRPCIARELGSLRPGQDEPGITLPQLTVSETDAAGNGGPAPESTKSSDQQESEPAATYKVPIRIFAAGEDGDRPIDEIPAASAYADEMSRPSTQVQNAGYSELSYASGCDELPCDNMVQYYCPCVCLRFFGEYLSLRARDAEVAYAVESDLNVGVPPIQVSPIALVDQDPSSGFRAGFGLALDACTELVATYTMFDTDETHQISRAAAGTHIESMVLHPATPAATTGTVSAAAQHDIAFDLLDVDYRCTWRKDARGSLGYSLGFRWGQLEQNFTARFTDDLAQPVNTGDVVTDIDFSGAGVRVGLEAERYACYLPLMFYAKGFASLMAGEFDATYRQTGAQAAADDVDTGWAAGRIVPAFDLELGCGYCSPNARFEARIGYVFGVWTNVVKTNDFIEAVQANDFTDMNDDMTFDGIVTRVVWHF